MNIEKILPLVQRPARYINSEWNSHAPKKNPTATICFCFPDIYEVGASNLGIEILYHLVNEKTLASAERCYCPAEDMEKAMRKNSLPLFSLESNTPVAGFDIVGFSLHHELCAGNLLNMLDLAGLPKLAAERSSVFPIVIGGGPVTANPEPFADFFDAFVLGEGEDAAVEILDRIANFKSQIPNINSMSEAEKKGQRQKLLLELAKIEGVYVPSLYDVAYNADGTVASVTAKAGAPKKVAKRVVKLEEAYFPAKQLVPFLQTVHTRLNIEVARGCAGMCRFCQAARYYFPWRQRSKEKILEILEEGLASTGYEDVSFSSLSSTDYKGLGSLLEEVQKRFGARKISVTLPSLRCDQFSLKVAGDLSHNKRSSLTFAPEAGTERLRAAIGKDISEKNIVETVGIASRMGWKLIKLYFMIGLPTETDEDIEGIIRLVKSAKKDNPRLNFNITISPFVPKAQTPFQWHTMPPKETLMDRQKKLERVLPASVKGHFVEGSLLEGVLARGDRRLSKSIIRAWEKGCRFDQWKEHSRYDFWQQAFSETGINTDFYIRRERSKDEILPWDHLQFAAEKELLWKENEKSLAPFTPKESEPAAEPVPARPPVAARGKDAQVVQRLRLRFSRRGRARFLSHLEQIDVLRRVIRRAALPAAFTSGFNPQVKASFGPAVSVGYESDSEYMELDLVKRVEPAEAGAKIRNSLPEGFDIVDVKKVPLFFPSLDSLLNIAKYRIEASCTDEKLREFLASPEIIIEKVKEKITLKIDAKPLIRTLENRDGGLYLELRYGPKKNIKPEKLAQKLLGLSDEETKLLFVRRAGFLIEKKDGTISEP